MSDKCSDRDKPAAEPNAPTEGDSLQDAAEEAVREIRKRTRDGTVTAGAGDTAEPAGVTMAGSHVS